MDQRNDGHLPASEADSDLLRGEGRGRDTSVPASEEEQARTPAEDDLDDGRPGKGGPGTIPPPD